jgi:hypothetical protein
MYRRIERRVLFALLTGMMTVVAAPAGAMRMGRRFAVRLVRKSATGAVVVALVGCGGAEKATTTKATPAATRASAAAGSVAPELVGTWTSRLTPGDAKRADSEHPGRVTIKVLADGTLAMYYPGANIATDCISEQYCEQSTIAGRGGKLTIGPTVHCADPAQYSFVIAGGKLKTKTVKDDCVGDRSVFFDGRTWRHQS